MKRTVTSPSSNPVLNTGKQNGICEVEEYVGDIDLYFGFNSVLLKINPIPL